MISFAVFTGCRVGEILGAAWSHIDWESGQFHVRRTFREGQFQPPKTRTSYRRLSLLTFLLKELKAWRLACPDSAHDLIFPNLDGQPMNYSNLMTRGIHPARKRAGIRKIRFHDLRHTFASLLISNGSLPCFRSSRPARTFRAIVRSCISWRIRSRMYSLGVAYTSLSLARSSTYLRSASVNWTLRLLLKVSTPKKCLFRVTLYWRSWH